MAFNPFAASPAQEQRRFGFKREAGAEFVVMPAVFDVTGIEAVLPELSGSGRPVLAGVHVLANSREAEFLANEVPGVRIPEPIVMRMRLAEAAGRGPEEGIRIAVEVAAALMGQTAGIVLSGSGPLNEAAGAIRAKLL